MREADPKRTFSRQYGESDANYLLRHWEELDMSLWYEHTASGHQLILSDFTPAAKPIGDAGQDGYASVQPLGEAAKLATAYQHYEDDFLLSVQYESDLAPNKPACDVLVLGTACASSGKTVPGFSVQLQVHAAPLPTAQPGLT